MHTATPGRMAPNAALCLVLSGLALICLTRRNAAAATVAGVACMLSGGVAVLAVAGYAANVMMAYGWFSMTQMGLPTALAFAALVGPLLWHCAQRWKEHPLLRQIWRPVGRCRRHDRHDLRNVAQFARR